MKLRTRLSLYFTLVSSLVLLAVLVCVYYLYAKTSRDDFYHRLHERINFAADVYLEADEVPDSTLETFKKQFNISLPREEIRFYDSNNISSFIKDDRYNWSSNVINQVRNAGSIEYREGERQIAGIKYFDNQGTYIILASGVDVNGKRRRIVLLQIMATLFLAQLFIQFFAGRWFASKILNPIKQINSQVQSIDAYDLHKRLIEHSSADEFSQLAVNFNKLLNRIEKAFDTQKMFIANASHELRTPLTVMMGEVEGILSKERATEEYKTGLKTFLSDTDRLHQIVENLLLLAYEEHNRTTDLSNTLRIDDLIWEVRDQFLRDGNNNLEIYMNELPENENHLYISGNRTLLLLAISNIIRNAFKFSTGKTVLLQLILTGHTAEIKIVDDGIGIDSNAVKYIFDPFFRTENADHYAGKGIGLYIANRIITLYKGRIEVESKLNSGSTFVLIFPIHSQD